jgi:hypothetical protein
MSITNLHCNTDERGRVLNATWTHADEFGAKDFCTTTKGEGVFVDSPSRPQCAGLSQFSVAGCTVGAARKRIQRWHGIR